MEPNKSLRQETPRYQLFIDNVHKALAASHKAFNAEDAVSKCYGNDAAIFVESNESEEDGTAMQMLANLIRGTFLHVNQDIEIEIIRIVFGENLRLDLNLLDDCISDFRKKEQTKHNFERNDQRSAQNALQASIMPLKVTINDIYCFRAHRMRLDLKEKLLREINIITKENANIEQNNDRFKAEIYSFLQSMNTRMEKIVDAYASRNSE